MSKKNSNSIISLSGWGQKHDSLKNIFSDSFFDPFFIDHLNYAKFSNIADFFSEVKKKNIDSKIIIGWSLGGQLAIRLLEQKIIKAKLLILIAPPFQFVKDKNIQAAMPLKTFANFYQNFTKAPGKTLKQFAILTAMNDRNSKEIAKNLDINDKNFTQLGFWLEELQRFSCFNVNFEQMPRTIFFQGAGDMIVHASQAQYFAKKIKNFRFELIRNCGHAPHLSYLGQVQQIIIEEIFKLV